MTILHILFKLLIIFFLSGCVLTPLKAGVSYMKDVAGRCRSVIDVHYYPGDVYNENFFEKAMRCPYTLNRCKNECNTVYLNRKYYDEYKEEYEQWGIEYPYPKISSREIKYPSY